MAERLARIFGTEEDKVNCPFYFKIGACRHGDKCTRLHNKPPSSQTLVIGHMYDNPPAGIAQAGGTKIPEDTMKELQRQFEDFYEDAFMELSKYGELEELIVCNNIGDHLIGNVYVKYTSEDAAEGCIKGLTGRYYAGKVIIPEYSPVTDFREARCRQYDEGECKRGGFCNFMHLKHVPRSFKRSLFRQMYEEHPEYRKKKGEEKSRRSKSKDKGKSGKKDKHKHKHKRSRSRSKGSERSEKSRSRSRSRSKEKRKVSRSISPVPAGGDQRQTSEERRAMIEAWNQEAEGKQ
jgi:splicing factor U2AF subunit